MSLPYVIAPLAIFAIIAVLVVPVLNRLFRRCHAEEITPEWLESFSPENYRAMEWLFSSQDFDFLLRQPGFDVSISRKLYKDRIKIFRQYLYRLVSDFNRLQAYGRVLIVKSAEDQSALLTRLMWLKFRFSVNVLWLEFSLFLAKFGFQPRRVGRAIAQLAEMSNCLADLAAVAV